MMAERLWQQPNRSSYHRPDHLHCSFVDVYLPERERRSFLPHGLRSRASARCSWWSWNPPSKSIQTQHTTPHFGRNRTNRESSHAGTQKYPYKSGRDRVAACQCALTCWQLSGPAARIVLSSAFLGTHRWRSWSRQSSVKLIIFNTKFPVFDTQFLVVI